MDDNRLYPLTEQLTVKSLLAPQIVVAENMRLAETDSDLLASIVLAYQAGHADGDRAFRLSSAFTGRVPVPDIPQEYQAVRSHYEQGYEDGWFAAYCG